MTPSATPPKPEGADSDAGGGAKPAEAADGTDTAQASMRNGNPSPQPSSSSPSSSSVADTLAQTLRDLARGEQTATTLEAHLTSLENRLDAILASLGLPPDEQDSEDHEQDTSRQNGDHAGERREGST